MAPGEPAPGRSRHWPEQHCANGDLVRLLLRHAVARDRPALPFGTLYTLFARWTRLGLWRRLLNRLILSWRQACDDTPDPSAVILDSRSCRSAPSCFGRGFDGGKKIKGIKIHLAVDKYGFPLAINVSTANVHDSKGIVPVLHQLAGFKGTALGDLSYRGQRLSKKLLASPSNPAPTAEPSSRKVSAG